jgi:hypothetical protein
MFVPKRRHVSSAGRTKNTTLSLAPLPHADMARLALIVGESCGVRQLRKARTKFCGLRAQPYRYNMRGPSEPYSE